MPLLLLLAALVPAWGGAPERPRVPDIGPVREQALASELEPWRADMLEGLRSSAYPAETRGLLSRVISLSDEADATVIMTVLAQARPEISLRKDLTVEGYVESPWKERTRYGVTLRTSVVTGPGGCWLVDDPGYYRNWFGEAPSAEGTSRQPMSPTELALSLKHELFHVDSRLKGGGASVELDEWRAYSAEHRSVLNLARVDPGLASVSAALAENHRLWLADPAAYRKQMYTSRGLTPIEEQRRSLREKSAMSDAALREEMEREARFAYSHNRGLSGAKGQLEMLRRCGWLSSSAERFFQRKAKEEEAEVEKDVAGSTVEGYRKQLRSRLRALDVDEALLLETERRNQESLRSAPRPQRVPAPIRDR